MDRPQFANPQTALPHAAAQRLLTADAVAVLEVQYRWPRRGPQTRAGGHRCSSH